MASGSFGVSTQNQYISGYVSWSSSTDVANNCSSVSATLYLSRTNTGYTTSGSGTFYISIDGSQGSNSQSFSLSYNSNTTMVSHSCTIYHNSDGTKAITISAWGSMPSTSCIMGTNSSTVYLDTIPRASQPSLSSSSSDMNSAITIYTNRLSSSFTHTIRYAFGNSSGTISTGVADSVGWTIPLGLANEIPNNTSGYGAIYCDTYNGGTLIGTKSVGFTAYVPASIVPSSSSISSSELNSSVSSNVGLYVQRLSNIRITINGASGSYGSSITGYQIFYNGGTYNSSSIDTGAISWSGNLTVTGRVIDSRGRYYDKSITLNALAYNAPNVSTFSLARCNSDGSANDMGTSVKVTMAGSASSLVNSTEKNTLSYNIYAKARTSGTWVSQKTSTSGLSLSTSIVLGTYDATTSYDFRLDLTDKFNTTMSLNVLPTGQVAMSWGKSGIGIGKVWEQGSLDVGGKVYLGDELTFHKVGNWSYIRFDAQTNDPAYIAHYEDNNTAEMRFCASDDRNGVDSFAFGSTPSNSWSCCTRIYTDGTIYTDGNIFAPTIYTSSWFRSTGTTGWYSQDYGGGWYMEDSSWIRSYNGKHIITGGVMRADAGFQLNNANTTMTAGAYNTLRVNTPSGYIDIGSQNTGWCHFNTDRSDYFFDKSIHVNNNSDGFIRLYPNLMYMGHSNEINYPQGSVYINYRDGGSGLWVGNGTSGGLGAIYGSTKSAIVGTENFGEQILYCDESPNHVFHDSGTGMLDEEGLCYVFLDPILLETVNTKMADYQVYLTSYQGTNAEILSKESECFIVCGKPKTQFDWLIRAERKGMERLRFNDADIVV